MRILASVLLFLFFIPGWMGEKRLDLFGPDPVMMARTVALDSTDPARRRVGRLTWLGGVRLTSRDPAFGGFSSMHVVDDRFTLLSDGGNVVQFRMDPQWRIGGVRFAELPDGPGTGWQKIDRDSESMTVDPRTGTTWVGFETYNAIWRYSPDLLRSEAHAVPPAMAWWPRNRGPEAMTLVPGGGMLVIAETDPWPKGRGRAGIRFSGDPTEAPRAGFRFSYIPPRGYDPSDMAVLPDGNLLILNRRFALPVNFTAKLTIVDSAAIRPGAVIRGREIATFAAPLLHDNFEGLAITREGAATIVWIVSDDNQFFMQRSLLLKFRLDADLAATR
jgi:hypothetical protein